MTNEVLIVASKPAAKAPAEIITALRFTPIIASTEKQALELLKQQNFRLIVISGSKPWQRLRDAAERKQPATRVLQLPDGNGDRAALRSLIRRNLEPASHRGARGSEERYRSLSTILESFTATLDLREVMRRIVSVARDEFEADRAWLLYPVSETSSSARIRYSAGEPDGATDSAPLKLDRSRNLIRKAMASPIPIVLKEGDRDLDPELAKRFRVRSEVVQILRPARRAVGVRPSSVHDVAAVDGRGDRSLQRDRPLRHARAQQHADARSRRARHRQDERDPRSDSGGSANLRRERPARADECRRGARSVGGRRRCSRRADASGQAAIPRWKTVERR